MALCRLYEAESEWSVNQYLARSDPEDSKAGMQCWPEGERWPLVSGSRPKLWAFLDAATVWDGAIPFRPLFVRKPVESCQGICRVLRGISQAGAGDCGVQEYLVKE